MFCNHSKPYRSLKIVFRNHIERHPHFQTSFSQPFETPSLFANQFLATNYNPICFFQLVLCYHLYSRFLFSKDCFATTSNLNPTHRFKPVFYNDMKLHVVFEPAFYIHPKPHNSFQPSAFHEGQPQSSFLTSFLQAPKTPPLF